MVSFSQTVGLLFISAWSWFLLLRKLARALLAIARLVHCHQKVGSICNRSWLLVNLEMTLKVNKVG